MRLFRLRESLRSSLWFVPALGVGVAIVLATGLVTLDHWLAGTDTKFLLGFTGSAEASRNILSVIASSMMTLTALVFTILIVVLQLTSTQFSPRVLRTFVRDRDSQVTLAIFVGTFTYTMLVLRAVRSPVEEDPEFVPALAVSGAFALVLLSLGVFVAYINHIAQAIRVINIITAVGDETRQAVDRLYPASEEEPGAEEPISLPQGRPTRVIPSPRPGVVVAYDADRLVAAARRSACLLVLVPAVGDFLPGGGPLLHAYGGGQDLGDVKRFVDLEEERTMSQDVAFGFRQLVDIAERGLSPAINDPTTAVQVLDQLHDFLRRLVGRPFPSGAYHDREGNLRLVVPSMSWEGYVTLACDEIRHYGEGSVQVARRMRAMLEDLLEVAPIERVPPIERQLKLLEALVDRGFPDLEDRRTADDPDQQGLGS
ncbi:MAG: DUF2254 domain-containing protein [Acidimicrobiia bacterium]